MDGEDMKLIITKILFTLSFLFIIGAGTNEARCYNIKKVDKATNGEVAYVYVPNTADAGHEYFKRYFFPQANKKAIIIDERYNGGGQLADYYIDILKKPEQAYWNFRYGKDLKSPSASIQGPKVMITDETAGSGGDYLPWMFRKCKLGTIVGKRTWGGLVGVLG